MKSILFITSFILTFLSFSQSTFCPRYIFDGEIKAKSNLEIKLSFTVLLDSTLVGNYVYQPNHGSLKIVGHLYENNSFILYERDQSDSITGIFKGTLTESNTKASGKWTSPNNEKSFNFILFPSKTESYWDYIKKNRSYYEYSSLDSAIINFNIVKSIDLASSEIDTLPTNLKKLTQIESINLLGNNFRIFPEVLTKLISLDEISLSSNNLTSLPPSIKSLKNLRILIVNFNKLTSIPPEIGQLDNLLYLELGSNNLTSLPTEIGNLNKLQELHLEGNNFSTKEKSKIKSLLPNTIIYF